MFLRQSPTNTDTVAVRGVIPNPLLPGMPPGGPAPRELFDGEFVTVMQEGVQPITVLGIPRAAVLSDQQGDYVYVVDAQNKAQRRPHPARPVDAVDGRREQWAEGRRAGHQRRGAAGPPRRSCIARPGEPAAGDFPGA